MGKASPKDIRFYKNMKILILADGWLPNDWGGASVIAFYNALGLKEKGAKVFIITTTQEKKEEGRFEYMGIEGERIYTKYHERWRAYFSLYNPKTVKRVRKIIADFGPDIVQAHNIHFYLSYACLREAKKNGAKVFLTAHDVMMVGYGKLMSDRYLEKENLEIRDKFDYRISFLDRFRQAKKRFNPLREFFIRYYLGFVDKIFVVSEALKDLLAQNGVSNMEVLRNGIDLEEWKIGEKNDFREKNNLEGKNLVMFGGRLSKAKGIEQAFLAIAKTVRELPNTVLVVFGDKDDDRKSMNELVFRLGLGKNIFYTGVLKGEDLKKVYGVVDLVLVPSVCFDSLPTVVLEAMAMEKPVIATCFGGAREMVDDEKTGYIVNPFDVDSVSEKIIYLLKNKEEAKRMGKEGRRIMEKYFSLETYIDNLVRLYGE